MGILSSIMAPELSPVREALELLEKELEDIKKAYKIELEGLKKSLSDINKKLLDTNETISLMETKVAILEKTLKSLQTDVLPNQPSPNSLDNSNNSQNNFSGQQPVANNPTDPIKRYFSNCGASGFEVAYMLSNPAAISGQGYYEVTDNGNETGNYQPNLELSATLLMNAANMLEPYFEVQHDDSGQLKVLSPGEVLRQGRTWQIVEKCKIAY